MKKGFTLIELLAVIVILAIIALIATPIVLNIINDSKEQANIISASNYIRAVGEAIATEELDITKKIPDGIYYIMNDGNLCSKNETTTCTGIKINAKISGTIPGSGQVAIKDGKVVKQLGGVSTVLVINNKTLRLDDNGKFDNFKYKCKRATSLHTVACGSDRTTACVADGYTLSGTKQTADIEYGNLGTRGGLMPGDAFDCDVNGQGMYKRFYYVSNYFDTSTKTFNNEVATLIYSRNVSEATDSDTSLFYYYAAATENWHGPVTAKEKLPTTSQWSNIQLYKSKRAILGQNNSSSTTGGFLPTEFDYSGRAARLLTAQELFSACGITDLSTLGANGILKDCNFLLEKTAYEISTLKNGFWLESASFNNKYRVWFTYGPTRTIGEADPNKANFGVRPVIDIEKSDMEI